LRRPGELRATGAAAPAPTRSPDAPGTPPLTPVGAEPGLNPPVGAGGNFLIGPVYVRAPEMTAAEGVPKGRVRQFTMRSADSPLYPGITKVPPAAGRIICRPI